MARFRFAPLILAALALASCGKKEEGTAGQPTAVAGAAAPAGTTWSQKVELTDEGVRMGNPDAAIKIIEYGSYTCPHCAVFNKEAHEAIEKDYVNTGKINFEYRNLVRDPVDITASLITHCADPASYFALTAQMFGNQEEMIKQIQAKGDAAYKAVMAGPPAERFTKLAELANLIEWGKQRGLPEDKLRTCLADMKKAESLAKISEEAGTKYNIQGTPSFLLNGSLLDNTATWDTLKAKLTDAGA
jgi:protein-disulfide isomerase